MKQNSIALCFSGQPRLINRGYQTFFEKIIKVYNPIVFVHTWFDAEKVGQPFEYGYQYGRDEKLSSHAIDDINTLYNPKSIETQPQLQFDTSGFVNRRNICMPQRPFNVLSGFYSMKKSNQLKMDYEKSNNIKFDLVIKCRFDIEIVEFSDHEISENTVYGIHSSEGELGDQIFYSNSDTMDKICNLYDCIAGYLADNPPPRTLVQEGLLDCHIKNNNIKKIAMNRNLFYSRLHVSNTAPSRG